MRVATFVLSTAIAIGVAALTGQAQAQEGGNRQPAGGAFMSSYSRQPYSPDPGFTNRSGWGSAWSAPSAVDSPSATGSVNEPTRRSRIRAR